MPIPRSAYWRGHWEVQYCGKASRAYAPAFLLICASVAGGGFAIGRLDAFRASSSASLLPRMSEWPGHHHTYTWLEVVQISCLLCVYIAESLQKVLNLFWLLLLLFVPSLPATAILLRQIWILSAILVVRRKRACSNPLSIAWASALYTSILGLSASFPLKTYCLA